MYNSIAEVTDKLGSKSPVINRGYKFAEECGEFMLEVAVELGISNKQAGSDGVIGEAADVCITCLSIVRRLYPELTAEGFQAVLDKKLAKWEVKNKDYIAEA